MNSNELLQRPWQGYPRNHQTRSNLLLHIITLPLFLAGNITLAAGVVRLSWGYQQAAGSVEPFRVFLYQAVLVVRSRMRLVISGEYFADGRKVRAEQLLARVPERG